MDTVKKRVALKWSQVQEERTREQKKVYLEMAG